MNIVELRHSERGVSVWQSSNLSRRCLNHMMSELNVTKGARANFPIMMAPAFTPNNPLKSTSMSALQAMERLRSLLRSKLGLPA